MAREHRSRRRGNSDDVYVPQTEPLCPRPTRRDNCRTALPEADASDSRRRLVDCFCVHLAHSDGVASDGLADVGNVVCLFRRNAVSRRRGKKSRLGEQTYRRQDGELSREGSGRYPPRVRSADAPSTSRFYEFIATPAAAQWLSS